LVRRWQAAKRQAKRRQDEAAKSQHAEAERVRRERIPSSPQAPKPPEIVAARGHAARIFSPTSMCDRPGCHEPVAKLGRSQGRYCCSACRQAVRRVVDRERKWLFRGTFRGRRAREQEYQAARARRCGFAPDVLRAAVYFVNKSACFAEALDRSLAFAGAANYCPVLVGAIAGVRWGASAIPSSSLAHVDILPRMRAAAGSATIVGDGEVRLAVPVPF